MGTFSETIGTFEHYVYKTFDSLGCLLYVGLTYNLRTRMKQHQRKSAWWDSHVYVIRDVYPDRYTAADAELQAILTEHPIYNVRKTL